MRPTLLVILLITPNSFAEGVRSATIPVRSSTQTMTRPNVVFILADDQSFRDFGFMGNTRVHTPNLDRLANRSARYPFGYVPMSVCRPSLASVLTGLYPHQHGIHFNHPPPGLKAMRRMTAKDYARTRSTTDRFITAVPTLPRILSRHGYATLQTGKHWEGSFRTAGFTEGMTRGTPAKRIGSITGTRLQNNGEPVAHGNGDRGLTIGRETMTPIVRFLDRHANERPFLIWYAPFLPHTPFDAPERFRTIYADTDLPEHLLPYYAEIARFDATVGTLLEALDERGLTKNTLIVFASDNGFRPAEANPSRQNDRSKLSANEDGLRTPILISWPGRTLATTHSLPVSVVDLVPTVLTAVGLPEEITHRMRGRSLWDSAAGRRPLAPGSAFGAIYPNDATSLGEPSRHVRARWVRDGDFKLIVPGQGRKPLPAALYDLKTDPDEQQNLIGDPAHRETVRRLTNKLDGWWTGTTNAPVTYLP